MRHRRWRRCCALIHAIRTLGAPLRFDANESKVTPPPCPFRSQNLTLKGQPSMFRAVKGKTPREQETPANWDWDAISPSPA